MRRTSVGPDPLLLLMLSSLGLGNAVACGGESTSQAEVPDETTVGGNGGTTGGVGAAGGAGGSTGGVGGAGAPPMMEGPIGCKNPAFTFGEEAGYVQCDGGFMHRPQPGRCEQPPVRSGGPSGSIAPSCVNDLDCADLENGRCFTQGPFGGGMCVSSCATDADCGLDQMCLCGPTANLCVPTNCGSDADCGPDLLCASYVVQTGPCSSYTGFACQQPTDDCTTLCPTGQQCRVATDADPVRRDCVGQAGTGGACGRPFLVGGTERLARATFRDEWRDATTLRPELNDLTVTERLALTEHWQAAALMEHASIAAFARFALELLALGAPPALVQDATSAMQDEQRHTTACFTLASAFAGVPVGPGPLPVNGCLAAVDLVSVTLTTFLEGCVGETLAAVEARELALTTTDPALRETLAGIAEDEARHALLAWSFLKWALEQGGATLAARVEEAWRTEAARRVPPVSNAAGLTPERALALGLPSDAFRKNSRRRVLHDIVKPCLDALVRASAPREPSCYGSGPCPPAPSSKAPVASSSRSVPASSPPTRS